MKIPTALFLLLALGATTTADQASNQSVENPLVKAAPGLYDATALPMGPTLSPGMEFTLLPEKYQNQPAPSGTMALAHADVAATLPQIAATWIGDPRWMSGVNFGGVTFFGSLSHGVGFFNSSILPEQYVPVEIRFSSVPAEQTLCHTYRRDQGYPASGVGTFPGSAWDISDTAAKPIAATG